MNDPLNWPIKEHFQGTDKNGRLYEIDRRRPPTATYEFAGGKSDQSMPSDYETFTTACGEILKATSNKRVFITDTPGNKGWKIIRI